MQCLILYPSRRDLAVQIPCVIAPTGFCLSDNDPRVVMAKDTSRSLCNRQDKWIALRVRYDKSCKRDS